jgi:hypothetical protein
MKEQQVDVVGFELSQAALQARTSRGCVKSDRAVQGRARSTRPGARGTRPRALSQRRKPREKAPHGSLDSRKGLSSGGRRDPELCCYDELIAPMAGKARQLAFRKPESIHRCHVKVANAIGASGVEYPPPARPARLAEKVGAAEPQRTGHQIRARQGDGR